MDIRVSSVIETYQRHFNLSRTSLWWRSGARRWASVVLLIRCLFIPVQQPDVGVQVLKDVELIRNSMVCCKCVSQMSWCVDINCKDVYRWRCRRITPALVCSASTKILFPFIPENPHADFRVHTLWGQHLVVKIATKSQALLQNKPLNLNFYCLTPTFSRCVTRRCDLCHCASINLVKHKSLYFPL